MSNYWVELGTTVSRAWSRFWFTPADTANIGLLRIAANACALAYVASFSLDLNHWFSADGILPLDSLQQLLGGNSESPEPIYRLSMFYFSESPAVIWIMHVIGLLLVTAAMLGIASRITSVASLLVVLSYVHRAPMLGGLFEPVLCMMLLYLCLAPTGQFLALDRVLARRAGRHQEKPARPRRNVMSNLTLRLIQVHLVGFYMVLGLTKMSGEIWWIGEASWSLMASTELTWFDFSDWGDRSLLVNFWTHEILIVEMGFAVLIWVRILRPLVLLVATAHWIALIPLLGMPLFSLAMISAGLAFLPPAMVRSWLGRYSGNRVVDK